MVWYVHAAKMPAHVAAIYNLAIRQDMSKRAFVAKLAVALQMESAESRQNESGYGTFVKYLQGARSVSGSSECRNGQALPAWQAPCR